MNKRENKSQKIWKLHQTIGRILLEEQRQADANIRERTQRLLKKQNCHIPF